MCEVNKVSKNAYAVDMGNAGQANAGTKARQPVQDTEETTAYRQALDRRIDYLRREMEKVYEARLYISTDDWQKRARVLDTINRAVADKQD